MADAWKGKEPSWEGTEPPALAPQEALARKKGGSAGGQAPQPGSTALSAYIRESQKRPSYTCPRLW